MIQLLCNFLWSQLDYRFPQFVEFNVQFQLSVFLFEPDFVNNDLNRLFFFLDRRLLNPSLLLFQRLFFLWPIKNTHLRIDRYQTRDFNFTWWGEVFFWGFEKSLFCSTSRLCWAFFLSWLLVHARYF